MAMTIGDANDVQAVARWILGIDRNDPDVAELQGDDARSALCRLLDRSRAQLGAGEGREAVDARWPVPGTPKGAQLPARGGDG